MKMVAFPIKSKHSFNMDAFLSSLHRAHNMLLKVLYSIIITTYSIIDRIRLRVIIVYHSDEE